ncbi:TaqI-like C-terminal specificity domain-containing protein [Butyrivibrio sp. AE3004]|uniref:TaqI-like C-terminal specificity domain-containing protein n=1 Tax=Butyrivibrio sp. AE3004 TaxID=1506994 RepID=UPI00068E0BD7|nr:TaqI-like C-terminal specificity domain-containing protein [Butyrivibrio sp. AE3004]
MYTLAELCAELSITPATGRNWLKLGKIKPEGKKGRSYYFSDTYVRSLKEDLESGKLKSLRSRRNKTYVSGNLLYGSYITADSPNLPLVQKLVDDIAAVDNNDFLLRRVLSGCAEGILKKRIKEEDRDAYKPLIEALKGEETTDFHPFDVDPLQNLSVPFTAFEYISGEDTLGLIYISLKHLQSRKSSGAYYTPGIIVQRLLGHLFEASFLAEGQDKKILDPGCGSGNFLLCLPPGIPAENIYGFDTDEVSVQIARLTLALKYKLPDPDFWAKHISCTDFLHADKGSSAFDVILGNPPWGSSFSPEDKEYIQEKYVCARSKSPDSYDLFIEQSLNLLKEGGTLSYVLPESVLLVKSHTEIRKKLIEKSTLSHLEYLGDVFDHVQCPSIILQAEKNTAPKNNGDFLQKHPVIYDRNEFFRIMENRHISEEGFDFLMSDEEYLLLQKLSSVPGVRTLKDNAEFALGIVTGANKEMLKSRKSPKNEIILKGSDIFKYAFHIPKCYITFVPEKCQQVAPLQFYRAPEKLLYRFIGGRLIFAYDNKQTLSLNSCNIVIPNINDMNIKYILAVLNSSVSEYFFRKKFRSVKVLRSHIEQLPIPFANETVQNEIVSKIDRILVLCDNNSPNSISSKNNAATEVKQQYDEIDNILFKLYELSEKDIALIKQNFNDENLFLPV